MIAAPAAAQTSVQSTTLIDEAVAQFTGHPVGAEGGAQARVDTRLRLARCAMPQFDWMSPAQEAVVVRCMAPVWKIYVPVRRAPRPAMAAAATPITAAPVTVRPAKLEPVIRRGDPITVEAGSAGFLITREGVAMGDAPVGGRLLVKVDPAKPPIQAVALETGRAVLPGFPARGY